MKIGEVLTEVERMGNYSWLEVKAEKAEGIWHIGKSANVAFSVYGKSALGERLTENKIFTREKLPDFLANVEVEYKEVARSRETGKDAKINIPDRTKARRRK